MAAKVSPTLFQVKGPLLAEGRTTTPLAATEDMTIQLKIYASGGENELHAHPHEDHSFIVLQGTVLFYDKDDKMANLGPNEGIILPRLRGAGCYNNVLLADSRMLTHALDGASTLPKHAGRHYTISGITAKGVFHPKITIQLGRRVGRMIITSANVTSSGLAGNQELAGIIDCTMEESGAHRIVAAALTFADTGAAPSDDPTEAVEPCAWCMS